MNIQACILAAGRGSRMLEATSNNPKCLVPLAGKPLFSWQLQALRSAGIENITVARGYKNEMLVGDFRTVDNPRWEETNMVGTLLCALPALDDSPCLVSYSDIVYHPSHVKALVECDADICMLYDTDWYSLWKARFEDPLDDAETFTEEGGILREIGGRTNSYDDIQGQFMGLMRFSASGFARIKSYLQSLPQSDVDKLDMTALFKRLLDEGVTIKTLPVHGKWCEADSMDDIACYERMLQNYANKEQRWSHDWR